MIQEKKWAKSTSLIRCNEGDHGIWKMVQSKPRYRTCSEAGKGGKKGEKIPRLLALKKGARAEGSLISNVVRD